MSKLSLGGKPKVLPAAVDPSSHPLNLTNRLTVLDRSEVDQWIAFPIHAGIASIIVDNDSPLSMGSPFTRVRHVRLQ